MRVAARISLPETIFGEHFAFLRDNALYGQTPKLRIPSPSMVHHRGGNSAIEPAAHPDIEEFRSDLTHACNEQLRGVHGLGCRYLQLDDTGLAYIADPAQRAHIEQIGGDAEHLHERYIENLNRALRGRPTDLTLTTHRCRGNMQSMWVAEGG
jgi:5-methyltetrahydropteroyltriglutamate--homocysteine methyltransferase